MREEKTISKCLKTLVSGFDGDLEILVSIPDEPTFAAIKETANQLNLGDKLFRSPLSLDGKIYGKPSELNELMKMAKGDFWVFADGDTYFGESPIPKLLSKFDQNNEIIAVSGRPVSADQKDNIMSYFGHLLADAAHARRQQIETREKYNFFPVSGYLFAMKKSNYQLPADALADDAYLSYKILNDQKKIAYCPEALVYVKYATNLADFYKQKKRSAGGFVQLKKYDLFKKYPQTRSFWQEASWFWFPIIYAKSVKEFFWSLALYPVRVWLWVMIFWEQKVLKKDFKSTWQRIESTK
jgi:cellulose synthase/poly-beta-1,6-N-acetylglucosamine synthase-like glycosyltransferase